MAAGARAEALRCSAWLGGVCITIILLEITIKIPRVGYASELQKIQRSLVVIPTDGQEEAEIVDAKTVR
jgi:hypothetical protein